MAIWVLKRIMNPDLNYDLILNTEFVLNSQITQTFQIGRGKACDILLTSLFVSRHHCDITFLGPGAKPCITDKKSENGTFVNSKKLSIGNSRELHEGSIIGVGVDTNDDVSCWMLKLVRLENVVTPPLGLRAAVVDAWLPDLAQLAIDERSPRALANGPSGPGPASGRNTGRAAHNHSVIVLDSDGDEVVVLAPSIAQPCVAQPPEGPSCVDSEDECVIIDDIPCASLSSSGKGEGVSGVASKDTALEVATEESHCVTDGLTLISVPTVGSDRPRPVENAETEDDPNNRNGFLNDFEEAITPNIIITCKGTNSTGKGDNNHGQNKKSNIPVKPKHNNEVPTGDVELRVEATGTINTTKVLHGSKVDQHIITEHVDNTTKRPTVVFKPTAKSVPPIKLHLTHKTYRDNNVKQELDVILQSEKQGNETSPVNVHSTVTSVKKNAVVVQTWAGTVNPTSGQRHVDAPEDMNDWFAAIADEQATSPPDVDVKPRLVPPRPSHGAGSPVSPGAVVKLDPCWGELDYTNSDIVEILIDDDDEAPFPSSQSLFNDGEEGVETTDEVSARAASPDVESVVISDDTDDDNDDDDDNVHMWYNRLSQEPGNHVTNRLIKVEECHDGEVDFEHVTGTNLFGFLDGKNEHLPGVAGSSKDSGTSLREVDSMGTDERRNKSSNDCSESSSENEDIFIHRPKRHKKAIVSTSEDEEVPTRRRLSEPVRSLKRKLSIDSDSDAASRRRSVELHRPTSSKIKPSVRNQCSQQSSTSKINSTTPPRYQSTELDPASIGLGWLLSGTDSDTEHDTSSSSRKKRQKLSSHIPVATDPLAAKISNHKLEKNFISGPVSEFSTESNDHPNNHKGRSDSDENISEHETFEQSSAHTSDSEQEELIKLVSRSRKVKSLDKSWHSNKDFRKPTLIIEALPMPHRRSHQRGLSENEAVGLSVKKNVDPKTDESLNKKSKKKETIEEPKRAIEKSSTKRMKVCVSPIKLKQNIIQKSKSNFYQSAPTASEKDKQKADKRKKLKDIAEKGKADAEEKAKAAAALNSKKVLSKPIVKITDRSRTILLAQDLTSSSNCSAAPQAKRRPIPPQHQAPALSSSGVAANGKKREAMPIAQQHPLPQQVIRGAILSSNTKPVPKDKCRSIPLKHHSPRLQPMSKLPKIPLLKDRPKHPSVINTTDSVKLAITNNSALVPEVPSALVGVDNQSRALVTITNTLVKKSCLSKINLAAIGKPKVKKCVHFIMEPSVRYYKPDNTPFKSVGSRKDNATPSYPRLLTPVTKSFYDTLSFILGWNVNWFQEQLKFDKDNVPPVHGNMQRIQVLSQYTSYSDYWKVMNPLMLLNLWACVSKDDSSRKQESSIFQFAIDNQLPCKEDPSLCRVYCHTLLNAQMKTNLPAVGDLIIVQLISPGPTNIDLQTSRIVVKITFGYIERVNKERLCDESIIHGKLAGCISEPKEIFRLVLLIKNRNDTFNKELLSRIKIMSYIRPTLRNFQAIAALSTSPLCKHILKPQAEHYMLPNQLQHNEISHLKGSLNKAQYEAVCRTAEVCLSDEPKICMIQGPPGTGKSFVIVNLINAILKCIRTTPSSEHYRILVCAPSNAALDELVRRLIGVRSLMPKDERFKLVRTGVTHPAMDATVKSISLEELVNIDIKKRTQAENDSSSLSSIVLERNTLNAKIYAAELQLEAAKMNHMDKSVELAYVKLATYRRRLDNLQSSPRGSNNMMHDPKQRRESERRLLQGANIIASTLASCTSSVMEAAFMHDDNSFGCCIIDEASQCSEPENLLPLLLGIKTLVLVGDPMQLPATTMSKVAKDYGFGMSLFSRLRDCFENLDPSPIQFLQEQYRMHPNILRWPNYRFYSNRLVTAPQIRDQRRSSLVPYLILKHDSLQDNESLSNKGEAELVNTLVNCISDWKSTRHLKIGVLTPYNHQRQKLTGIIKKRGITISTIDGFQGQESDVIIMSCVRTEGTGFMVDEQRLNVALTRAKCCLIICANFQSLNENATWRSLHDDAIQRNVLKHISSTSFHNNALLSSLLIR